MLESTQLWLQPEPVGHEQKQVSYWALLCQIVIIAMKPFVVIGYNFEPDNSQRFLEKWYSFHFFYSNKMSCDMGI